MKRNSISEDNLYDSKLISESSINDILNNKRKPSSMEKDCLSKILGVNSYIIELENPSSLLYKFITKSCWTKEDINILLGCKSYFLDNLDNIDIEKNIKYINLLGVMMDIDLYQYMKDVDLYYPIEDIKLESIFTLDTSKKILKDSVFNSDVKTKLRIRNEFTKFLNQVNHYYEGNEDSFL